jgi:tRNA A-37 threonylcarbamoyl transferase component Bud32
LLASGKQRMTCCDDSRPRAGGFAMPAEVHAVQPSSALPIGLPELDTRIEVRPDWMERFRAFGLATPEAFLAIPGVIVSGHPDRHVMRVVLADGTVAYLKREHRVRWRDRLRNWRAGFGRTSKSVREARVLQHLDSIGLPAPRWLAFGDDGAGRAFLLIEETSGAVEIRRLSPNAVVADDVAVRFGRFFAELHEAGIDHPDVYAKHVLIDPNTLAITLLDWQRTTVGATVSWPKRVRALAALLATLPDTIGHRLRARFLWAYRRVACSTRQTHVPSFAELARRIQAEAGRRGRRRGTGEQTLPLLPDTAQRLVWLDGEALCAIPELADELDRPWKRLALYDPTRDRTTLSLSVGQARLAVSQYRWPVARFAAWLRGRAWRSNELRQGRLLFHLERHHIPAPKLFAYGQRCRGLRAEAFLLCEAIPEDAQPLTESLRRALPSERQRLVDELVGVVCRLQQAGCEAASLDAFACHAGTIGVVDPGGLQFRRRLSDRRRRAHGERLRRSIELCCGPGTAQLFIPSLARHRQ